VSTGACIMNQACKNPRFVMAYKFKKRMHTSPSPYKLNALNIIKAAASSESFFGRQQNKHPALDTPAQVYQLFHG
ncbi:MAG: hypothetical protein QMD09_02980, partial [Desulfatibacillaceae bacterium]|nr:hypothetical protein [Desulfatibacillaceae bacterium]